MKLIESGDPAAPIWIVGEAPGKQEMIDGAPFVGPSGWEKDKMFDEAGLPRHNCFITNVAHERPEGDDIDNFFTTKTAAAKAGIAPMLGRYPLEPVRSGLDHLTGLVRQHNPRLIVAFGGTALWALTGQTGIMKWRGSEMELDNGTYLVPTIHPAAMLREYSLRPIIVQDLRRAAKVYCEGIQRPLWSFRVRPRYDEVQQWVCDCTDHRRRGGAVTVDIETRGGQIACVGIATDKLNAICIPLMCVERPEGYWSPREELDIWLLLRGLLEPKGAPIIFQNGAYDLQYFAKQFGFLPAITDDTMIMQHILFPGLFSKGTKDESKKKGAALKSKSLDFLSSMYCEYHYYWKDDGKTWESWMPEEQLWRYNCEDCVRTFEVWERLAELVQSFQMSQQIRFQMRVFHRVLVMMLRGVNINQEAKRDVGRELGKAVTEREAWLLKVLGHELNPDSPKQMSALFYGDFGLRPVMRGRPPRPTLDDEALKLIARRTPLIKPLTDKIEEYKSLRTFKSNFADMRLSADGRARCSFNIAGAHTLRFSSSEDIEGSGRNLQNLPKGTEDD